jgi:hypothetical protein
MSSRGGAMRHAALAAKPKISSAATPARRFRPSPRQFHAATAAMSAPQSSHKSRVSARLEAFTHCAQTPPNATPPSAHSAIQSRGRNRSGSKRRDADDISRNFIIAAAI